MNKNIVAVFSVLVFLLLILTAGCTQTTNPPGPATPTSSGTVTSEKVFVIGVDDAYPPFTYTDANGMVSGFDYDCANLIARDQDIKVIFKSMNREDLITALNNGEIDVIYSAYSKTPERAESMLFSDVYWVTNKAFAVKTGSSLKMDDINRGRAIIGAQAGSTSADWVKTELIDAGRMPATSLQVYETLEDALDVLQTTTKLDTVIADVQAIKMNMNGRTLTVLGTVPSGEEYAIGISKNHPELVEKFNTGLANLKKSGDWDLMVKKYGLDIQKN
ncbi:MAG: amino acid ABC transporter substrate-binding protein [Methanomicrobium sp.]|nr:amino acid ABC transporter substrate-binding protein [Methanomicrobium sp.]